MRAPRAIARGVGRALGAPRLLLWLWLANLALALPAAVLIEESLYRSIGPSRVAERLTEGFDMVWFEEYEDGADGFERSFEPSLVGAGAFFHNLDDWLSGRFFTRHPGLVAFAALYVLIWIVLVGGALDHLARRPPRAGLARLLQAGGRTFWRLLRLAAIAAGVYWLIYRLARALFPWIQEATVDVTAEKTVLALYVLGAAAIALLLLLARTVFDYAKIVLVAEDRRSALLAALRGLAFVLRHPLASGGVVAAYLALGAAALVLYAWLAPGPGQATWLAVFAAFAGSQLFLASKLGLRLALLASEIELYGGRRRAALPPPL